KQAELRETRIGIDDDAVRQADRLAQLRPDGEPIVDGTAPAVCDREMPEARIGGEQLPAFLGTDEPDGGIRELLFRRVENRAGNGDVGAQGDTRKHENVLD